MAQGKLETREMKGGFLRNPTGKGTVRVIPRVSLSFKPILIKLGATIVLNARKEFYFGKPQKREIYFKIPGLFLFKPLKLYLSVKIHLRII